MDTLLGTTLGGYTLVRALGSGGMGTVYLAEDASIGQQVAIKVIRTDDEDYPDATSLERANERFRQEARAVASLDHLHILPLYRYGEEETAGSLRAYMIMQYRPEGSLWDWLRQRAGLRGGVSLATPTRLPPGLRTEWPLSVEEAGEYLRQAASALQYAHDRGIVHRDIKPANFLLRVDSDNAPALNSMNMATAGAAGKTGYRVFLLLSDFGLAKFFSTNSATSSIFGTPTYMAPEQFEGVSGPESDQYALAVMIYYLLAGRPPFEGDPMRLMHQHITAVPPPIRTFIPTLSVGAERVLAHALAKKPTERYPSIAAFAEDFTQRIYEATSTVQQNVSPPLSLPSLSGDARNRLSAHVPAMRQRGSSPLPPITPYNALTVQAEAGPPMVSNPHAAPTVYPMQLVPPTITPPQQQYMMQGNSPYASAPISQPVHQGVYPPPHYPLPAPQAESGTPKRVSRRGALGWILGGTAVMVVGAYAGISYITGHRSGIKAVLQGHTAEVTGINWSPDGQQLVSASRDRTVRIWSATTQQSTATFTGHTAPVLAAAWNTDGTLIASGGRDKEVQVWNTAKTVQWRRTLVSPITSIAWLNATSLVAGTLGRGVYTVTPTTDGGYTRAVAGIAHVAVSPDGTALAVGFENGNVSIFSLNHTHAAHSFYPHHSAITALAWSPDGTLLASGGVDTFVQVFNGSTGRLVRSMKQSKAVTGVAWEPNNSGRLAAASSDSHIYVWSADGHTNTVYTGHKAAATSVAWSTQEGLASASVDSTIILWNV